MKKLKRFWKILVLLMVCGVGVYAFTNYVSAATISINIEGEDLSKGTWRVDDGNVIWKAKVYNPDGEDYFDLSHGELKWESSDTSIVEVVSSSSGKESIATLKPKSSGKVTIKISFEKIITTEEGEKKLTASASKNVVVKFEALSYRLPSEPYEDTMEPQVVETTSAKPITWTSSNSNVVTVNDDGAGNAVISMVGAGSATIDGKSTDGQKISFPLVVNAKFTENVPVVEIPYGAYHSLKTNAVVSKEIYYESKDLSIAKVDTDGIISGVHAGRTSVNIYAVNSKHKWYNLLPDPPRSIDVIVLLEVLADSTSLSVGDTIQMRTNIEGTKASFVNWTSSDTSIATVDSTGVVKAVQKGKVKIHATVVNKELFGDNDMHTSSIEIDVIDKFMLSESVHIMNTKTSFELNALVTDKEATVVWESSDELVAKVTTNKKDPYTATITGVAKGKATITATQIIDGAYKKATCEVTVNEAVVSVTISPNNLEMVKGEQFRLIADVSPEDAYNKNINWSSSDTSVVTVDNKGLVKAVNGGTAVVYVVTEDGLKVASCTISVRVPVKAISLDIHDVVLDLTDKTYQLTYSISPNGDGVEKGVEWSSSAPSVATVNANGLVTILKPGRTTIIVKTKDITEGGNLIDTCDILVRKPVESVKMDFENITLRLNESFRLTALVTPSDATNKDLIWVSSNNSVARVNDNGLVTAVGSGAATIMVKTVDKGFTSLCNVTVYQPVTGIKLSSESMTVRKGQEFWLKATILPDNAAIRTVHWASNDDTVAEVDQDGKVTAKKPGECVISATSQDTGVTARCAVKVTQPVTGIKLNVTKKKINTTEQFSLLPTVTPSDADNKNVIFSTSNENVAVVDENGVVTGIHGGKTVIVAKTEERGLVASCLVEVNEFVEKITVTASKDTLNIGDTLLLSTVVEPGTATNRAVNYESSKDSIVKVNKNGMVKAVGVGKATVYAKAKDGSGVYGVVQFNVIKKVSRIDIAPSTVTLYKGFTAKVNAKVYPNDATEKSLMWSSSDQGVASVDAFGIITGNGAGTCTISAISQDGTEVAGICRVRVKEYVSSINVTSPKNKINVGESVFLKVEALPQTATNKSILFESANPSIATVDYNGMVKGKKVGKVTIYAKAKDGSGVVGNIQLTIEKRIVSLSINPRTMRIHEGDTARIYANISPADATNRVLKWESSDNGIATVDGDGFITAISPGACTITASSKDGTKLYATCRLTVTPTINATSVVINSKNITMLPGQTRTLLARFIPTNAEENVQWYSADTSIATVDKNGTVYAKGQGNTQIYAVSSRTSVVSSCDVTVLALNASTITIGQYDTHDLHVFGATEKVLWISNNKRVATVSANGLVVGRMPGTTTITAKVNGKVLYCTVHVTRMY